MERSESVGGGQNCLTGIRGMGMGGMYGRIEGGSLMVGGGHRRNLELDENH